MNKSILIKKDFILQYSKKYNIKYNEAKELIENVINLMNENFKDGNSLIFRGFGSFMIKETKRKEGINPKTKEVIKFKPKKYIKFKVSSKTFEMK